MSAPRSWVVPERWPLTLQAPMIALVVLRFLVRVPQAKQSDNVFDVPYLPCDTSGHGGDNT
jgi:hypothetical protein